MSILKKLLFVALLLGGLAALAVGAFVLFVMLVAEGYTLRAVECDPNVLIADVYDFRGLDLSKFEAVRAARVGLHDSDWCCLRLQGNLSDVSDFVASVPAKKRFPEEGFAPYSYADDERNRTVIVLPSWFAEPIASGKYVMFRTSRSKMHLYIDTTRGDPCVIYVMGCY